MKALYITTPARPGGWLAEAFAGDSASQVLLEEALGTAAGLARLRDEVFDAILVWHEPGELDALELIEGYRAGGADEPVVVLGAQGEPEMAPLCFEVGADGYVCVPTATTRNLIWVVARGVQRRELVRENQRFHQGEQVRLQREHEEAQRLLGEQRALVEPPEAEPVGSRPGPEDTLAAGTPRQPGTLWVPWRADLVAHYRELLRGYVIMGSGNLAAELQRLAELLVAAGLTAQQALQLHIEVVEELVRGLGARSSRHVMTRADLLVLEVMMDLAEGYRRRYADGTRPPLQKRLPGLE
jgi:DNA-binding response OmpR family regulator